MNGMAHEDVGSQSYFTNIRIKLEYTNYLPMSIVVP